MWDIIVPASVFIQRLFKDLPTWRSSPVLIEMHNNQEIDQRQWIKFLKVDLQSSADDKNTNLLAHRWPTVF